MKYPWSLSYMTLGCIGVLLPVAVAVQAAEPTTLTIFAAGTLAVPFKQVSAIFEQKYPNVAVQAQFGGSVKMAKQITELHQESDLLAVADYSVIPKYLFANPAYAAWYVGIARNAITFVYTDKSKYANEINADNWYKVLARKGVEIGRSDPDTDPSGYQTVQTLNLAEKYYNEPGLEQNVLAKAPLANMRDTETSLISASAARADRLSRDLPLRRVAASSQVRRPAGQNQSQRPGRVGLLPARRRSHQKWRSRRQADRLCHHHRQRQQNCRRGGELRRASARAGGASRDEEQRLRRIQSSLCGARRGHARWAEKDGRAVARLLMGAPVG